MNTQKIVWILSAIILVSFVSAVIPSGSPAIPQTPSFPNSNDLCTPGTGCANAADVCTGVAIPGDDTCSPSNACVGTGTLLPLCAAADTVACGDPITSSNSCGSCTVNTGTLCADSTTSCDSTGACVSVCTDTCVSLGKVCGTQSVCGSSINCGSCTQNGEMCNTDGSACVVTCTPGTGCANAADVCTGVAIPGDDTCSPSNACVGTGTLLPLCAAADTVACGDPITSSNSCGSCTVNTGTFCTGTDICTGSSCVTPPPTTAITLSTPQDGDRVTKDTAVTFTGDVTPRPVVCSLLLNGFPTSTLVSISQNAIIGTNLYSWTATHTSLPAPYNNAPSYEWGVNCTALNGDVDYSNDWTLNVSEEPTLVIENMNPGNDGKSQAEVLSTFNATFSPSTANPTCSFNLTNASGLVENDFATVTGNFITYDYMIMNAGDYTWSFTCVGDATNTTKANITVDPADAVLSYTNTMTDKNAYNTFENVTFATIVDGPLDESPEACALYLGKKGSSLVPETISASSVLSYEKQFNESGEYSFYFNCTRVSESIKSPTIDFTIRENISITDLLPVTPESRGYGPVIFQVTTNIAPEACDIMIDGGAIINMSLGDNNVASYVEPFSSADVGLHSWDVSCSAHGRSTISDPHNLTIEDRPDQSIDLQLDKKIYTPGEKVTLTARLLTPRKNISVNLFEEGRITAIERTSFGSLESSSGDGYIIHYYFVPFDADKGNFTFFVKNTQDASQNGTVDFTVEFADPSISLSGKSVVVNETLRVKGYDFFPELSVNFSVTGESGLNETLAIDKDGEFTYEFVIGPTLGKRTINIKQNVSGLAVSRSFTVFAINNAPERMFYEDSDEDGYGFFTKNKSAKIRPTNYVENSLDCNDANENINPLGAEICDGLDNNCDGLTDTGPLCTAGSECASGQCVVKQEIVTPTLNHPTPTPPPETSANRDPVIIVPSFQESDESTGLLWWILIPFLALILLGGGFLGFVAYEGYFDVSSPEAFIDGVKKSLGIVDELPQKSVTVLVPKGDYDLLSKFITGKRKEGYDDLTIRNSLLKKGWREPEVDEVFDEIYH